MVKKISIVYSKKRTPLFHGKQIMSMVNSKKKVRYNSTNQRIMSIVSSKKKTND